MDGGDLNRWVQESERGARVTYARASASSLPKRDVMQVAGKLCALGLVILNQKREADGVAYLATRTAHATPLPGKFDALIRVPGRPKRPRTLCAVAGCGCVLSLKNTSGVCKRHRHTKAHCACAVCRKYREDYHVG